jgi:hypothetical protein
MGGSGLRRLRNIALCLAIAGCGGDDSNSPLPELSRLGGPVMAHPALVPIFFAGDPDASALTQFSQWIVHSQWLTAVGAEYGVGSGSVLGPVQRSDAAPTAITNAQIADLVFAGLADGSLPKPPGGDLRDALYMLQFPKETVISFGSSMSCVDFGGYHASARRNGVEVAYAVIATCPGFVDRQTDLEIRELVSSHELIEAATDPIPDNHPAFQLTDAASPWLAFGEEVADLCTRGDPTATWHENGFVAQRSWSNAAAAAGKDPCVPGQQKPYFNAVAKLTALPRISPGAAQMIELSGWVTDSQDRFSWPLEVGSDSPADAAFTFSTASLSAAMNSTLTVRINAGAAPGKVIRFAVFSDGTDNYQILPMFAVVADPCSRFTGCVACAAQLGCGFCNTTGTCESLGSSGSADSSCPASAFAVTPGACSGFCASRGTTCAACTSLSGCGWCASGGTPQCVEASDGRGGPATGSCPYADWSVTSSYCSP